MANLDEIRRKLQQLENKNTGNTGTGDNAIYPFWNLPEGGNSLIRFLPDGDSDNTFFWVERQMIKLTFPGVIGGDSKEVMVQVPCVEMWNMTCPVLTEIRPWFNDTSLEAVARKYWKKRSYFFQGLVMEDGLKEENSPENPIRRFIMGPQLFKIIKSALLDPEMTHSPADFDNGTNFRIVASKNGQYSDYTTSKWSMRTTALTEDQRNDIEQHGLFNLSDFLPKRPDEETVAIIKEMFEASVNGEMYDPAAWGNYYKPYGLDLGDDAKTTPKATKVAVAKPVVSKTVESDTDVEKPTVAEKETAKANDATPEDKPASAKDILEMLRKRNQASS